MCNTNKLDFYWNAASSWIKTRGGDYTLVSLVAATFIIYSFMIINLHNQSRSFCVYADVTLVVLRWIFNLIQLMPINETSWSKTELNIRHKKKTNLIFGFARVCYRHRLRQIKVPRSNQLARVQLQGWQRNSFVF